MKLRYASYLSRYFGRTLAGEDEASKNNALTTASVLLMSIPEGEEGLLTIIVNKIGDPGRKIASAAGHQLRLILEEHPVMINVVAREVSCSCVHRAIFPMSSHLYVSLLTINSYIFRFNSSPIGHISLQGLCTTVLYFLISSSSLVMTMKPVMPKQRRMTKRSKRKQLFPHPLSIPTFICLK